VRRGDIIVFRYPLDIRQMYVKRVIGVPGDRIHIENKLVHVNGKPITEPYKVLIPQQSSAYLNNFPQTPDIQIMQRGLEMLRAHVDKG
jgi:signal peptidase I